MLRTSLIALYPKIPGRATIFTVFTSDARRAKAFSSHRIACSTVLTQTHTATSNTKPPLHTSFITERSGPTRTAVAAILYGVTLTVHTGDTGVLAVRTKPSKCTRTYFNLRLLEFLMTQRNVFDERIERRPKVKSRIPFDFKTRCRQCLGSLGQTR